MNELAKPLPPEGRAAIALSSTQMEIDLRALTVKNASIVHVIDKAGREQAHGAAMELKRARVEVQRTGDDARDDANKFSKSVIAEVKRLVGLIEPEEKRLIGLRDAWDDEQARIKAEEEAKEKARIAAIHARIAEIRNYPTLAAVCKTASSIAKLLDLLKTYDLSVFAEFTEEANCVYAATVSGVEFLLAKKREEEAELARIKAEQASAAAALKQAQDKAQAEQAAAAAKLADERASLEKERAELASAQAAATIVGKPVDPLPTPTPTQTEVMRPTDMEIVSVLADHFLVHVSKAITWLLDMDLDAVAQTYRSD